MINLEGWVRDTVLMAGIGCIIAGAAATLGYLEELEQKRERVRLEALRALRAHIHDGGDGSDQVP